jgi:hypothetical protein
MCPQSWLIGVKRRILDDILENFHKMRAHYWSLLIISI